MKSYKYMIKMAPEELQRTLYKVLAKYDDIVFKGNVESGNIESRGSKLKYKISTISSGVSVSLMISKKQFFIPWSVVKNRLDVEAKKW